MNKKYIIWLIRIFTLNFIIFQSISFAQDKSLHIDKLVTGYVESGDIHGTILVAESGNIIYSKAFGLTNMEWDIPNDVNTKYRIY